ncbi:Transcriptional regulator of nonfermentable carbon utilization [Steccherinum ochraceum]|uniref:Transcription activator of gluconeogenesis ERT1 n=1 Tax=Steccherinum ochraceum TaxID=92696 RepID=A0A4R0RRY3_9APHY|nr:Transcriptional regulator of nonfermentable carbon utilization [Steccherinum ochraceum]
MDQNIAMPPQGHPLEPGQSSTEPSAPNTPIESSKKPPVPKRKRTTDGASDSADSTSQTPRTRDGPKKKKANRACFHCQKAHLTCDDSRPCQRCIKRGMADNCTEGHRKKAKYLLDEEELEALKRQKSGEPTKIPEATPQAGQSQPLQPYMPPANNSMYSYDTSSTFPNYAPPPSNNGATLEYSIISSILNPSAPGSSSSPSDSQNAQTHAQGSTSYGAPPSQSGLAAASWPAEPQYASAGQPSTSNGFSASGTPSATFSTTTRATNTADMSPPSVTESAAYMRLQNTYGTNTSPSYGRPSTSGEGSSGMPYDYQAGQQSSTPSTSTLPFASPNALSTFQRSQRTPSGSWSGSNAVIPSDSGSNSMNGGGDGSTTSYTNGTAAVANLGGHMRESGSVYKMVTKKYDYTEGYHFLMKHISCRKFEKNDILRIVRALAIFRPSLIALQMPMTEEDEVFIEKCFQRSLVELDKLVSFSGTPTVAWRRTGEICLVGPEFCLLSGWEKEELLGRKKYIYELFENQSVVEYWENFANHAFENTTQDIMDLPSLVIGQWLPLL